MKKLIWFAGMVAMVSAGSVYAAPVAPQEAVDFRAVNPVLQSLVEAVTAADELVDFAYPRFDETYCDLKAEKLKYDVQGTLKNTPWLEGGRADLTGTSKYWTDRSADHSGVHVTMSATVRTDTLALIRYSAYIVLRKVRDSDIEPKFLARFKAHLRRLAVVTSLEQVNMLLASGQTLAKEMFVSVIEKEEDQLRCIESGQCVDPGSVPGQAEMIERQKSFIASLKKTLPAYDQIKFESKIETGKMRELSTCSPDVGLFILDRDKERHAFYLIPGKVCMVMAEIAISANADAFHKVSLTKLDDLKEKFETDLVGVQNGNSKNKERAQKSFRQALVTFKKSIRGDW